LTFPKTGCFAFIPRRKRIAPKNMLLAALPAVPELWRAGGFLCGRTGQDRWNISGWAAAVDDGFGFLAVVQL